MTTSRHLVLVGAATMLLAGCAGTRIGAPPASAPAAAPTSSVASPAHGGIPRSWARFMVQCMSDKGWKVTIVADDQVDADAVPEEQRSRYQHDSDACDAIHRAAFPLPKLTEASVKDLYAQELATKGCLEKLGIPVDPPISEQATWMPTSREWLPRGPRTRTSVTRPC